MSSQMDDEEIRTKFPAENQVFYVLQSLLKLCSKDLGKQLVVKCMLCYMRTEVQVI